MTTVVVDASVVAQLFFAEPQSVQAAALFRDAARNRDALVAPSLLPIEVTNTIRKRMRDSGLTLTQATEVLDAFLEQPIALVEDSRIHRNALHLATAHGTGAHDAHYVALAEMFGCEFWVDDQRLLRAVQGRLPNVRWIGAYQGSVP